MNELGLTPLLFITGVPGQRTLQRPSWSPGGYCWAVWERSRRQPPSCLILASADCWCLGSCSSELPAFTLGSIPTFLICASSRNDFSWSGIHCLRCACEMVSPWWLDCHGNSCWLEFPGMHNFFFILASCVFFWSTFLFFLHCIMYSIFWSLSLSCFFSLQFLFTFKC